MAGKRTNQISGLQGLIDLLAQQIAVMEAAHTEVRTAHVSLIMLSRGGPFLSNSVLGSVGREFDVRIRRGRCRFAATGRGESSPTSWTIVLGGPNTAKGRMKYRPFCLEKNFCLIPSCYGCAGDDLQRTMPTDISEAAEGCQCTHPAPNLKRLTI
jgi:hypothetical protein